MNVFYAKSVLFCDRIVAVLRVPSQRGKGRWQPYRRGDGTVAVLRVPSQGERSAGSRIQGATGLWRC